MKRIMRGYPLPAILLVAALWVGATPVLGAESRLPVDRSQPIQIVSNRLEAFDEKKMVVFSGDAVATQGDKTIKADSITLHYKKGTTPAPAKGPAGVVPGEGGELEKIVAQGHVQVSQGPKVVTGDSAVYDQDAQQITMTGNAVLREGANVIRGERITVLLNENRGVVEGGDKRRVTAVIYPEEKKDKKK